MSNRATIAVLGGSFDPPHIGHLVLASRAREALGVDRVALMPAAESPGKGTDQGHPKPPSSVRLELARAAASGVPWLDVFDNELRRTGPSFTIETVEELRRLNPESDVVWIIGSDQAARLHTWHRAAELVQICGFAVAVRPPHGDVPMGAVEALVGAKVAADCVAARVEMPLLDVSSREIRRRIAEGKSVEWLVPDAVLTVIRQHGLYQREER